MTDPPMADSGFRIEHQPFDSGRIARRVGVVHLTDPPAADGDAILAAGRRDGYDLLTLRAGGPAHVNGFRPLGVLLHLRGALGEVLRRTHGMPIRHRPRPIEPGDWPRIASLLPHAAPTRFSRDSTIGEQCVRRHKLDMLRSYADRDPEHALVLEDGGRSRDLMGFQLSCYDGQSVLLYEIAVRPDRRRELAALALLLTNLRSYSERCFPGTLVRTRIYEDNAASLSLFEKLGLQRTGQCDHYYHARP